MSDIAALDFRASARRTLTLEQQAIGELVSKLDDCFDEACKLLLECRGRLIVTGMGKSGHIARKMAATLASTGSPAFYVHPGEASHGDLGMITGADVVIALSNSGETQEITGLLPLFKRLGAPLVSLTGRPDSTLARYSDVHIDVGVSREACPHDLAPTSSTTATLAMGDALALALLEARGFSAEDFALSHPGGTLGKRLLLRVADLMHEGNRLPSVPAGSPLREALLEMTLKGMGFTCVVDERGMLVGVYTDGDLRRTLDQRGDFALLRVDDVMTRGGKTASPDMLAAEAVRIMEDNRITALAVVENGSPVGALHMHDLLRSGVI
ncbi:KpsF/GutQ family sugar-phosphate isomerase [Salinicola corii]|uniref:Arabinose 5-phosphate isomerase n=1 Tax=Salinicola corii TaxID=2606937 RepID=A0A640WJZ4_9GAMM|nr:KpsF/GutQ family sugar-phosphate isomerase [Salinicola corii]KAA0020861.1 KpsF/GutQ family sugar-phosphate isomerase [Salinicola corii]